MSFVQNRGDAEVRGGTFACRDGDGGGDVAQRDGRADCAGESVLPPAEQQLQIHMRWK